MSVAMTEEPTTEAVDPFDRRPTLIFQATPMELSIWGSMTACAGCRGVLRVRGGISGRAQQPHGAGGDIAAIVGTIVTAALVRHSLMNPPSSIGLNVVTRRYKLVKGGGSFRRVFEGTFDDIRDIETYAIESSRGIDGYMVAVTFRGNQGRCDIERHGANQEAKAHSRAAKLAGILGVAVAEPTAKK